MVGIVLCALAIFIAIGVLTTISGISPRMPKMKNLSLRNREVSDQGEIVEAGEFQITLSFAEDLLEIGTGAQIVVSGPQDGQLQNNGCSQISGTQAFTKVALDEPGEYLVGWRVVSGDGHPISGSYSFTLINTSGFIANPALASRKDLRDAVVVAKAAQSGWANATAFNRGQILYRVAEIMQGRSDQFIDEICALEGVTTKVAKIQVEEAIDTWVWYSGWCDKLSSVSGSLNQVSGPFYNFTTPEALGVVAIFAENKPSLLGVVRTLAPVIASGNSAVLIASESYPLPAITLSEVLATSDVPAGVVNILTGKITELAPWVGSHMEIDGVDVAGLSKKQEEELKLVGADNLKRIFRFSPTNHPERILSFMEQKTVWHPVGL